MTLETPLNQTVDLGEPESEREYLLRRLNWTLWGYPIEPANYPQIRGDHRAWETKNGR